MEPGVRCERGFQRRRRRRPQCGMSSGIRCLGRGQERCALFLLLTGEPAPSADAAVDRAAPAATPRIARSSLDPYVLSLALLIGTRRGVGSAISKFLQTHLLHFSCRAQGLHSEHAQDDAGDNLVGECVEAMLDRARVTKCICWLDSMDMLYQATQIRVDLALIEEPLGRQDGRSLSSVTCFFAPR